MLSKLLGLEEGSAISHVEAYLRQPWPRAVIILLMALAMVYVVLLYRRERTLTRRRRFLLGGLRCGLYAIVILLLFEPTLAVEMQVKLKRNLLVMVDTSSSMEIADSRTQPADVEAAAQALGQISFTQKTLTMPEEARKAAATAKRIDLAKGILTNSELALGTSLSEGYNLRYFTFGEKLDPASGKGEALPEAIQAAQGKDPVTRLGSAITEAVGRFGGQPIAGIIVLTDGASNDGLEPLEVARRMRDQVIPLYPVGLGLPNPPDVRLRGPIVGETVFVNDRVPVRVQVSASGYNGQSATLTLSLDGKELESRRISLDDRAQFVEMVIEPKARAEAAKLEVWISKLPGEITTENNTVSKTLRVIDDKIKVIYVEGKPRWEYRYLRRVLLRDHRLDVKFLMTEGDRDLAKQSDKNIIEFPTEAAKAFDFDLVILGDVNASYFSRAQLQRIEELVRQRQGSLLMLAGLEHAPASYAGSPIEPLLPVKLGSDGWRKVEDTVFPRVTDAGQRSALATLEVPDEKNQALWQLIKPMYKLPSIDGVKPGATTLVELSANPSGGSEPYPLISWQRYGSGKTMLVASDQLWRLRFKRGDQYHARLWGQTIQFLTLSRLLGGNKRVHLELERNQYRQGERVTVSANVLDESYEPIKVPNFTVNVRTAGLDAAGQKVVLEAIPHLPGLYEGHFTPDKAGRFEVAAPDIDPKIANVVGFEVLGSSLEQREPAMQEETLRKMAALSGGQYVPISQLPQLAKAVGGEERQAVVHKEKELWDVWPVFVAILLVAGTEWFLRRRFDLI